MGLISSKANKINLCHLISIFLLYSQNIKIAVYQYTWMYRETDNKTDDLESFVTFSTVNWLQLVNRKVNKHSRSLDYIFFYIINFQVSEFGILGQIISSALSTVSLPACFMPSLSLTCCDLLATVTFFPLISLLQSTPNTAAKVIFLVHDSDHVESSLSPSGGFLSHYSTRSNFSSAILRLCKSLP